MFTSLGGKTDHTGQVFLGENIGATQDGLSNTDLIKITWFEQGIRHYNYSDSSCKSFCDDYTQVKVRTFFGDVKLYSKLTYFRRLLMMLSEVVYFYRTRVRINKVKPKKKHYLTFSSKYII